ncbi:SDR family oxidoreductase [uncultured Nitrospira sp.]|uniref:SDR family NAD(P)-dependent oxidoreductase n=1 Tax=uncultured Nitrospira sp. TaxID=157176 RepID=UPI00313FF9ED
MVELLLQTGLMNNITPFAVITGASRGIGAEYARALAAQGYDLLLVARDQNRLNQLTKEIQQTTSIQIWTETLDLARPHAAETLYQLAQSYRPHVSLLVNNAGFGLYGLFAEMPLSTIQAMLQLHIHATTESTRLFLPDMMNRREGAIINVASVAGFFPIPYMAEYAATKAFIISFSEAVAMEAKENEVTIQVCCPGYTETDFHKTAEHCPRHISPPHTPHDVVQKSLKALRPRQTLVTIGWHGLATQWITPFIPKKWLMRLIFRFIRSNSSSH